MVTALIWRAMSARHRKRGARFELAAKCSCRDKWINPSQSSKVTQRLEQVDKHPISIIVVNRNGARILEQCLADLFRQSYQGRQIIVVDNGSTDRSVALVQERFPEVTMVELPRNTGFTGGNAEGLKAADGEFIALVNNDTRADARWLENLVVRRQRESPRSFGIEFLA